MAHHAAGVPRLLLQKDRLDTGLVEIVVEGGLRFRLGEESRGCDHSQNRNPGKHRRTEKNHGPPPSTLLFLAERLAQFQLDWNRDLSTVMRGHSRPKDGVASLAYDPRIHDEQPQGPPCEH